MDYNKVMYLNVLSGVVSLIEVEAILQISLLVVSVILSVVKGVEIVVNTVERIRAGKTNSDSEIN